MDKRSLLVAVSATLLLANVGSAGAQQSPMPQEQLRTFFDQLNLRAERAQTAMAAVECGLRDPPWMMRFAVHLEETRSALAERMGQGNRATMVMLRSSLHASEHTASQAAIREIENYRTQACPRVQNSPLLRELDEAVRQTSRR